MRIELQKIEAEAERLKAEAEKIRKKEESAKRAVERKAAKAAEEAAKRTEPLAGDSGDGAGAAKADIAGFGPSKEPPGEQEVSIQESDADPVGNSDILVCLEEENDYPELLTDDPRRDPEAVSETVPSKAEKSPKELMIVAEPEQPQLVTLEMPSVTEEVAPYQMLRIPVSIEEEAGREGIRVFCKLVYDLPMVEGTDADRRNEREVRIQRESPLVDYKSPILFEIAVATGGITSSKLRLALDHAMVLTDDHYLAFLSWFSSLENWLHARLTSTPEGRAILAAEIARLKSGVGG